MAGVFPGRPCPNQATYFLDKNSWDYIIVHLHLFWRTTPVPVPENGKSDHRQQRYIRFPGPHPVWDESPQPPPEGMVPDAS
jgi:hypothetical protein